MMFTVTAFNGTTEIIKFASNVVEAATAFCEKTGLHLLDIKSIVSN